MAAGWRGLCSDPGCAADVSETLGGVARKHGPGHRWTYDETGRLRVCPGSGKPLAARYETRKANPAATAPEAPPVPVDERVAVLEAEIAAARADADRLRAELWRTAHTARCLLDANRAMLDAMTASAHGAKHAADSSLHLIEAQRRILDLSAQAIPDYPNS